ncbi:MAG: c-type cytochrome [Pirellulaceae bacterium]|nr:c-type cytochrome [Pirellulaceae bacterium]
MSVLLMVHAENRWRFMSERPIAGCQFVVCIVVGVLASWLRSTALAQDGNQAAGDGTTNISAFERPFDVPAMTQLADGLPPFSYRDVGGQIPNYLPSSQWGTQGEPLSKMQEPLSPDQAIKHLVTPQGFRVELFAAEPDLQGKPICMAWDERGRLWVAETYDYPNELQPPGLGRDRIRICTDTDGDGRADRFTVFAEGLSIPTSIAFSRGGVIVQNGTETLLLKDTNGDDVADLRQTLITGWALGDTHGGVSNFRYGLDNHLWAMQGYNASQPVALGQPQQSFRMGFFRMRTDGSQVEFIRSTNNNTWGLGISEQGFIFGSTANGCPSVFMPIPNRYYERVRGWAPELTLSSIADSNRFLPITDKVRQVDHFGGYTAAAGHALYTARQYPQQYWNRVAFVAEPTGHLVAAFVLSHDGSGFKSTNPFNLLASDDEWSSPIMAEVGPDGNVWVLDWYNYIVQHNPTPKGFQTGKGNAYESQLRDKRHGRIYRIVHEAAQPLPPVDLALSTANELVAALRHSVMLVRLHAQRLLVERGKADVVDQLVGLLNNQSVDAIGLNVGAIHALWVLHGLGQIQDSQPAVITAVHKALEHPSPAVVGNAVQVLPHSQVSVSALLAVGLHVAPNLNVRLSALLALADLPAGDSAARAIMEALSQPDALTDRLLIEAAISAAANSSTQFLTAVTSVDDVSPALIQVARKVATHEARGEETEYLSGLLKSLAQAPPDIVHAIFEGMADGWPESKQFSLSAQQEQDLLRLLERSPTASRLVILRLARAWGSQWLADYSQQTAAELLGTLLNEQQGDQSRIEAAGQVLQLVPDSGHAVGQILDAIGPRNTPELSSGLIAALRNSSAADLGQQLVRRLPRLPPSAKREAIGLMMSRPALTAMLLESIGQGQLALMELALDQRQALAVHPDALVRAQAKRLLSSDGALPNLDRQQVLEELAYVAQQKGDPIHGQVIFKQHCSKCHQHGGQGVAVGPDLSGMAVHPKEELLMHILDPSRSVEGNFRAYTLLTTDGRVLTGMLAAETRTTLELYDAEGKRNVVLREDIEQLIASPKSLMPDGFEKSLRPDELRDLLEFLTQRGRFIPLDISKVATVASDRGMFLHSDGPERMLFDDWSPKTFHGVPFNLVVPRDGQVLNAILLHSKAGSMVRRMPRNVSIPCSGSVKAIHMLGGVAGWAHPLGKFEEVAMVVRLTYADGQVEEHPLLNGIHIADYVRRVDVPGSEFAFDLSGRQLRYLAIQPARPESVVKIDLVTGSGSLAPLVMAITVETGAGPP